MRSLEDRFRQRKDLLVEQAYPRNGSVLHSPEKRPLFRVQNGLKHQQAKCKEDDVVTGQHFDPQAGIELPC